MALANDLAEWPFTGLDGCTNLRTIEVFGEPVEYGTIQILWDHKLHQLLNLISIVFPSTVKAIGLNTKEDPVLPANLRSLILPKEVTSIGYGIAYHNVPVLDFVDFNNCNKLQMIFLHAFRGTALRSLDLSSCTNLTAIREAAFYYCNNLRTGIFPPSLTRIDAAVFETGAPDGGSGRGGPSPVKTIIWKGRTERPPFDDETGIHSSAFVMGKRLDELVASGEITEIFLP